MNNKNENKIKKDLLTKYEKQLVDIFEKMENEYDTLDKERFSNFMEKDFIDFFIRLQKECSGRFDIINEIFKQTDVYVSNFLEQINSHFLYYCQGYLSKKILIDKLMKVKEIFGDMSEAIKKIFDKIKKNIESIITKTVEEKITSIYKKINNTKKI